MKQPYENEFLNKNVVITGASSGIGQSAAFFFLNSGAHVILAGQDIHTLERMCKENKFSNAIIMQMDLTQDIHIFDFKTSIVERLQTVDILVNCAGVKLDGDIEKTFPQELDFSFDINLRTVFCLIKLLKPFLSDGASIINLSCLYGTRPCCGLISYAMSKAGLETLTKYAAAEFAEYNIRVNAITACPVRTNSLRLVGVNDSEINSFEKKMEKNIPLGRIAHPDDVVKCIAFLASCRSSKITGQIIKVDGGRALTSSGYVHYMGCRNMNSRFEPDNVCNSQWFTNIKTKIVGQKKFEPIENVEKLKQFVEEKIKESNFSTRDVDAHLNVNANYKNVNDNDEKLIDRFKPDRMKGGRPTFVYNKIRLSGESAKNPNMLSESIK